MAPKGKGVLKRPAAALKRPAAASKKAPVAATARKRPAASTAISKRPAKVARTKKAAPPKVPKAENVPGLTALLLGLERRPDRRQRCEAMLDKHLPWLKHEFFRATDGKSDTIPDEEVSKTWNTKCNSFYGAYEDVMDKDGKVIYTAAEFADPGVDYEFSPGERGCAHSHHRMWQFAAGRDEPTLILEDDVEIEFDRTGKGKMNGNIFTERLALGMEEAAKKSADVLYLGWSGFREGNYKHHKAVRGRRSKLLAKAEYVWTTVAYVIWPAGAKKLLDRAQPMDQPVDNFMGWECREGRLHSFVLLDEGDTNDTWAGGIVTQLDFTGDSDIKKSDGGDQGDDPTAYLASIKRSDAGGKGDDSLVDVPKTDGGDRGDGPAADLPTPGDGPTVDLPTLS